MYDYSLVFINAYELNFLCHKALGLMNFQKFKKLFEAILHYEGVKMTVGSPFPFLLTE